MKLLISLIFITSFGLGICPSKAQEVITFGPQETKIIGSIPYSVIGKYKAEFSVFKGRIILDEKLQRIRSVYLEIQVSSIKSNSAWCDRIARSRRLLYAARYPKIIFKSDHMIQDENGYKVQGVLEMHGISRRLAFPFNVKFIHDQKIKRKWVNLKGNWSINRKDFDIIWNKLLDHGGVVVGDNFTVSWELKALY